MLNQEQVEKALHTVLHPKLHKSLVDIGMIRDIVVQDDAVSLTLALKSEGSPLKEILINQIKSVVTSLPGVSSVQVATAVLSRQEIERLFPRAPLRGIGKVKNFLAVASGKGGVGKTTIAVNVALAFARQGKKVGLLDADVYGPSVPLMLDTREKLKEENGWIIPKEKFGLRIVSLGMTAGENDAFIWRGPLVGKMIHHLLDKVEWGELDYLVIDLPPGTGDPSISIAHALPRCYILMITTPQEIALADVRRSIGLFGKTGQKIVGLVENMSYFVCAQLPQPIEIFGSGGGEQLSRETNLPLLGAIPLDLELGRGGDKGVPLLVSAPNSATGKIFAEIAEQVERIIVSG